MPKCEKCGSEFRARIGGRGRYCSNCTKLHELQRTKKESKLSGVSSTTSKPLSPNSGSPSITGSKDLPNLHFIWFGTPDSLNMKPVHAWARYLPESWEGISLWVDHDCSEKFSREGGFVTGCKKGKTGLPEPDEIRKAGQCPIYIMNSVPWLEELKKSIHWLSKQPREKILTQINNISRLTAAINFEKEHNPPFRMAQVASDIMRIIVLRYCGGAYFDFDVEPSGLCKFKKFTGSKDIPLNRFGVLCHRMQTGIVENDIIFADINNPGAIEILDSIISAMAGFYRHPRAREQLLLEPGLSESAKDKYTKLQTITMGDNIGEILPELRPEGELPEDVSTQTILFCKFACLVQQGVDKGNSEPYKGVLGEELKKYCDRIKLSIHQATFQPFKDIMSAGAEQMDWERIKGNFTHRTVMKPFYSWKDPGTSTALKVIDAATDIQAQIRVSSGLRHFIDPKKEATKIQTQFRVSLPLRRERAEKHLINILKKFCDGPEETRNKARCWLSRIRDYCGHEPSIDEIDRYICTLRLRWPD